MARRILNRRELRAEAEAAEAMGISNQPETRRSPQAGTEPARRKKPVSGPRTRVVWAVCDLGGRPVAKFDYASKAAAEALIIELKAKGKGTHFLRSLKEPIPSDRDS